MNLWIRVVILLQNCGETEKTYENKELNGNRRRPTRVEVFLTGCLLYKICMKNLGEILVLQIQLSYFMNKYNIFKFCESPI